MDAARLTPFDTDARARAPGAPARAEPRRDSLQAPAEQRTGRARGDAVDPRRDREEPRRFSDVLAESDRATEPQGGESDAAAQVDAAQPAAPNAGAPRWKQFAGEGEAAADVATDAAADADPEAGQVVPDALAAIAQTATQDAATAQAASPRDGVGAAQPAAPTDAAARRAQKSAQPEATDTAPVAARSPGIGAAGPATAAAAAGSPMAAARAAPTAEAGGAAVPGANLAATQSDAASAAEDALGVGQGARRADAPRVDGAATPAREAAAATGAGLAADDAATAPRNAAGGAATPAGAEAPTAGRPADAAAAQAALEAARSASAATPAAAPDGADAPETAPQTTLVAASASGRPERQEAAFAAGPDAPARPEPAAGQTQRAQAAAPAAPAPALASGPASQTSAAAATRPAAETPPPGTPGAEGGRRERADAPPIEPVRPQTAAPTAAAQRVALTNAAAGGYAINGGAVAARPQLRPIGGEALAGARGEALTAHAAAVDPALSAPQPGAGRLDPPQPVVLTGPPHAQLRAAAQAMAAAGDGDRVELRLDPPELGRVMIHMRIEDGALSAQISADRPETLELMRRNADVLQRELLAAGFGRADLDFSGQRRQQADAPIQTARDARDAEQSASAAPVAVRRSPGDRLDIRL